MDPVILSTIVAAAIKGAVEIARLCGASEEEAKELFEKEWKRLQERDPSELPDP
jgi:hypothetical protein